MNVTKLLLDRGLVDPQSALEAEDMGKREGIRTDQALLRMGLIDEDKLLNVVGDEMSIPYIDLTKVQIDQQALESLPSKLVYRKRIVPVQRYNGSLKVATSDPFDLYALDELGVVTGLKIVPVLSTVDEIDKFIRSHFGVGGDTIDEMVATDTNDTDIMVTDADDEDLLDQAQEASVIKLVNEIFIEGIKEGASDIHVEPFENDIAIRYRIDGVLHDTSVPPQMRRFQAAIISRIKIMANLNIAEKRLPQDGRIKLNIGGRQVDIRVSIIPMLFGEGVVMRVLDTSNIQYSLNDLGMFEDTYQTFHEEIKRPHGIILVTGPTGSGKTTTLYASLNEILSPKVKIITVEDPVEYHLQGVNQIQVHHKVGLTFANGLRAILRHDPDIVMLGEIRDRETAEVATQAALTGHLVLSTLHTNDACSAATRLLDMGVEPFLVTSTLTAAMAQRLVRTICSDCKESYDPDPAEVPKEIELQPGQKLYRGRGCRKCRNTGYRGRLGLYELMVNNDAIREQVMARASASTIRQTAQAHGLKLLRDDGWRKVLEGRTTPEEVIRMTVA